MWTPAARATCPMVIFASAILTPYPGTRCRLHPMQTATKQLWAGVLAAAVGSLCCVAPLVLLTLGISGAWIGQLTALEPYRPIFIAVATAFMGIAALIAFPWYAPLLVS